MNTPNIEDKKLFEMIKAAVSEAVREELLNYKLSTVPYVDDKEMKEIQNDLEKKICDH